MDSDTCLYIYLGGIIVAYLVRIPYVKRANRGAVREDRVDFHEGLFSMLSFLGMFVAPFFALSPLLARLDYSLPGWAGWLGTIVLALAIFLLWRAHADLGRNWSATVRIREGHALVTDGVYSWMRHPLRRALADGDVPGTACPKLILWTYWVAGFRSDLLLPYSARRGDAGQGIRR